MLEFDPKTITIRELLDVYNRVGSAGVEGKGPATPRVIPAILKKYEDTPAYEFFYEDDDTASVAREVMTQSAKKGSIPKSTTQTFRYLSNLLSKGYDRNPPNFLARKADDPAEAVRLFGVPEAAKTSAKIAVSKDPEKLTAFYTSLAKYEAENPKQASIVRAIHFGLNTGLRPSAYVVVPSSNKEKESGSGLFSSQYLGESGSLYIEGESTGAKSRDISVPLNNTADLKIQEQINFNAKNGLILDSVEGEDAPVQRVFLNPDGNPVTSAQVNTVLSQIKVPKFIWDAKNKIYYDNFMLDKDATTKKGMQIFRNFHTQYALTVLGIPEVTVAKLQGRGVKSVMMNAKTGSLMEYDGDIPGETSSYEREMANRFVETNGPLYDAATAQVQQLYPDYTFDYGSFALNDKRPARITENTEGLGDYFKKPRLTTLESAKKFAVEVIKTLNGEPAESPVNAEEARPALSAYLEKLRKFRPQAPTSIGEEEEDSPSVGEAVEMAGTAVDVLRKPDPVEDEGSFATPPRGFINKAGRVARKVLPYAGLTQGVLENLQPSEEGQPRTAYDLASGAVDTAKDLFSRERGDISPSTSQEPSTNPEYNLSSEMQQSLQKPTPAYMSDSRPFEDRLREYKQNMQNIQKGK